MLVLSKLFPQIVWRMSDQWSFDDYSFLKTKNLYRGVIKNTHCDFVKLANHAFTSSDTLCFIREQIELVLLEVQLRSLAALRGWQDIVWKSSRVNCLHSGSRPGEVLQAGQKRFCFSCYTHHVQESFDICYLHFLMKSNFIFGCFSLGYLIVLLHCAKHSSLFVLA